ncbi:hypothetical protein [Burkholderia cepacia]|uniref:hypothetical protein n=1 Tax=Burkholderia cepacia TaxID=292 RepID=UPI0011BEFA26|nr:hypothetical protein [Burkholderia cepacia]QFS35130.1 hypothetical protein BURCE16_00035 [Burkholderia cepacia]
MTTQLENEFINHLRHHLAGWRQKVQGDFSKENFEIELAELNGDPVYPRFFLNTPGYVNIRFMGRVSISIGRRLGEIYDRVPRLLAAARYNLSPQQVAPKFGGLELDIGLSFSQISVEDANFVRATCAAHLPKTTIANGIGIEIRYNFNPNDSSRLRKDEDMASKVKAAGLTPVYLVFSSISPREEAIARLQRAGWNFIVGQPALDFATALLGLDLSTILDRPAVKAEIEKEVGGMMNDIKTSYAFMQF